MTLYGSLLATLGIIIAGVMLVYYLLRRSAKRFEAEPRRRGHRRRHPLPDREPPHEP